MTNTLQLTRHEMFLAQVPLVRMSGATRSWTSCVKLEILWRMESSQNSLPTPKLTK
jgi:hypothetical protein